MRWVTMKPPKILTAARVTATNPMIFAKLKPCGVVADEHGEGEDRQLKDERCSAMSNRRRQRADLLHQSVEVLRQRPGIAGKLAGGLCKRGGIRHETSVSSGLRPPDRRRPAAGLAPD